MNVKKYKFDDLSMCQKTDKTLLEEAEKRGFYNGYTEYNNLFSELFFNGGKLNFKKDLDGEELSRIVSYLKSFMTSYEPKHEEKEAICALLLSEIVD